MHEGNYYFRWIMHLTLKRNREKPIQAVGMSHVRFDTQGYITFHQDYWDTGIIYEQAPVLADHHLDSRPHLSPAPAFLPGSPESSSGEAMTMNDQRLRIAVVGAGVAGIVAAYLLSRRHDVTLYERNDYIGGHTNTIAVPDGKGGSMPVDTGFIVFNDRTYPLFTRFLDQLDVKAGKTDMSFSYSERRGSLEYASRDLDSLFAQRKNLLRPPSGGFSPAWCASTASPAGGFTKAPWAE